MGRVGKRPRDSPRITNDGGSRTIRKGPREGTMSRSSAEGGRRWDWVRVGLLTVGILAGLSALGGATRAEANGVKRISCALPFVVGQPNFFCSDLHKVLIL